MKSEVGENIITEFCAINAKCYSYRYLVEEKKENKTSKGVIMPVVDKTMDFNHYQKVLESNKPETRFIHSINKFYPTIIYTFRRESSTIILLRYI